MVLSEKEFALDVLVHQNRFNHSWLREMQSRNAEEQHQVSLQKAFGVGSSAELPIYIVAAGDAHR